MDNFVTYCKHVYTTECQRRGRRNVLIFLLSVLNERTGQLYKAVPCKVTKQLKTETRMDLKHI